MARLTAKPGQEDAVRRMSVSLVEPSRAEPGNLSYGTYNDATDPRKWLVVEEWESRAAFEAHLDSPHMRAAFAESANLLEGPPVEQLFTSEA